MLWYLFQCEGQIAIFAPSCIVVLWILEATHTHLPSDSKSFLFWVGPRTREDLKQVCHASCSDSWTTEPTGPITLEVAVAGRHDVWRLWKALVCDSQGRFLGCGSKVMLSSADNYFPLRNNNSFGLSAGRWWRQNAPDHRTLHYYMTWATHCKWGGGGGCLTHNSIPSSYGSSTYEIRVK